MRKRNKITLFDRFGDFVPRKKDSSKKKAALGIGLASAAGVAIMGVVAKNQDKQ